MVEVKPKAKWLQPVTGRQIVVALAVVVALGFPLVVVPIWGYSGWVNFLFGGYRLFLYYGLVILIIMYFDPEGRRRTLTGDYRGKHSDDRRHKK